MTACFEFGKYIIIVSERLILFHTFQKTLSLLSRNIFSCHRIIYRNCGKSKAECFFVYQVIIACYLKRQPENAPNEVDGIVVSHVNLLQFDNYYITIYAHFPSTNFKLQQFITQFLTS